MVPVRLDYNNFSSCFAYSRGLDLLVSEGGWVDKTMNIGTKGMFELIRRG